MSLSGMALAEETCPPLKVITTIDLNIHPNGAVTMTGSVGGQPTEFALSTTILQSAITPALADAVGLTRQHSSVVISSARGSSNEYVTAKDVVIGNLHFGQVLFRITPEGNKPRGIVALDLLRNYDLDFDFAAGKLNVISREHCPDKVVYWPSRTVAKIPMRIDDQNHIFFKMDLDGHQIETTIAIGAPRTTLRQDEASSVFNIDENSPGSRPVKGNTDFYLHKFGTLSSDGLVIKNPDVLVIAATGAHMPGFVKQGRGRLQAERNVIKTAPLQLGMSTLKQLHMYIAFHDQTLYFTPAKPDQTAAEEPPGE